MLDTNMNMLATLGPAVPPPVALGQGKSGISQPRFDALLSELARAASESGKPKDAAEVPARVKEALRGLLLDLVQASPTQLEGLSKNPQEREAWIRQAVEEGGLQKPEADTLEQLVQAALLRIVEGVKPVVATPAQARNEVRPGTDPGPQGGTPGSANNLRGDAANRQLAGASLNATEGSKGKYVGIIRGLTSSQKPETPEAKAVLPNSTPDQAVPAGGKVTAPPATLNTLTAGAVNPAGLAPQAAISGPAQQGSDSGGNAPVAAGNASVAGVKPVVVSGNARLVGADPPIAGQQQAGNGAGNVPVNTANPAEGKVVAPVQANPAVIAAVEPGVRSSQNPSSDNSKAPARPAPLIRGQAQSALPVTDARGQAPAALIPSGTQPSPAADTQKVIVVPVSTQAAVPVKAGEVAATPTPASTSPVLLPAEAAATEPGQQASANKSNNAEAALPLNRPQVVVQGAQPEALVDLSTKFVLNSQTAAAGESQAAKPGLPVPVSENQTAQARPQGEASVAVPATAARSAVAPQAQVAAQVPQAAAAVPAPANQAGEASSKNRANGILQEASAQTQAGGEQAKNQGVGASQAQSGGQAVQAPGFTASSIGDLAESVVKDFQLRETVLRQVSAHLDNLEKGVSQLRIELQPKQLGRLEIALTTQEGRLVARLVVGNADVREVIAANLQAFQDTLENRGIQVQELSVALRSDVNSNQGKAFENQPWMFKQGQSRQEEQESGEPGWPPDVFMNQGPGGFSVLV